MELITYDENRPWGSFSVLQDRPHYKLKVLTVKPGNQLSLQMHYQREEHWIVSRGRPQITVDDKTWQAEVGEYIYIPRQAKHRLGNNTSEIVEIIEVQQGESFSEEDIVRFQDDYQRV
jgi:mannose-6-phosphate isomerase-like protein (cupin superfamily)